MKHQKSMILATLLLSGTSLAPAAFAQDASAEGDQVKAVYERARPDYDAQGVRSGSFLFYPKVTAEGTSNSNIYATDTGRVDDFIVKVKPSFNLVSDWNSDFFSLSAKADIGRHLDNGTEDYEDFGVAMDGRKDISNGTDIHVKASYDRNHEDRGSADAVGAAAEQTTVKVFLASAGFKRDVSVMSLAIDGEYAQRDFDDTAIVGGGTINNDDRDRYRVKGIVRVGYELSDGYEAFVRGTIDRVKYDDSTEDGGPNRNSKGFEAVTGAAFDLTGKAKGEFFVGYMKRDYDTRHLTDTDGFNFGASLLWNATGLTSFQGTVKRGIEETTVTGTNGEFSSGIVSTLISGRVEHELRRNVLLAGDVSYTRMSFEQTTREDDMFSAGVSARYLLNPNFYMNAGYKFDNRSSNAANSDYKRHAFRVGVTGQW